MRETRVWCHKNPPTSRLLPRTRFQWNLSKHRTQCCQLRRQDQGPDDCSTPRPMPGAQGYFSMNDSKDKWVSSSLFHNFSPCKVLGFSKVSEIALFLWRKPEWRYCEWLMKGKLICSRHRWIHYKTEFYYKNQGIRFFLKSRDTLPCIG